MKIKVSLYRLAPVPAIDLKAAVGLADKTSVGLSNAILTSDDLNLAFKEDFGPLLPNMRFFVVTGQHAYAGSLAMVFDVTDPVIPQSGFIHTDLMDEVAVRRLDGAIEGELSRYGIVSDPKTYTWRVAYEVSGN